MSGVMQKTFQMMIKKRKIKNKIMIIQYFLIFTLKMFQSFLCELS